MKASSYQKKHFSRKEDFMKKYLIFAVMAFAVIFAFGTISPVSALEKSPLQKNIEKKSAEKRIQDRQKEIDKTNKQLQNNRNQRQKSGGNDKLDQSTRDAAAKRQQLEKQNQADRDRAAGKKPATPQSNKGSQPNYNRTGADTQRDINDYKTFGPERRTQPRR
jgi:type IV secretory pathway TrbL component